MNWKGTKGEFKQNGLYVVEIGKHPIGQSFIMNHNLSDMIKGLTDVEGHENARLWVDAQNTIQQCDKMPSELLAERNEAVKLLKDCMAELYTIHSQYGDKKHARDHSVALTEAESFIKQIEVI